jgi:hypothetical protein
VSSYPPKIPRTEIDGLKVVKDEVLRSNLPPGPDGLPPAMKTTRVLTMEDGSVLYGCGDCKVTGATRGDIRKHRNQEHGVTAGSRRSPARSASDTDSSPLPYPAVEMLGMTLYELLELSAAVSRWEQVFGHQEAENNRLRQLLTEKDIELAERTRELRMEQRDHERLKARIAKLLGVEQPAAEVAS